MRTVKIVLLVSLVGLALSWPYLNNDYMTYKHFEATVVTKEEHNVHKRGMWGKEYWFLYQLADGRRTWQETDPKNYARDVIGEPHTLTLREMDIKQTGWNNLLYFVGPCLLVSFSITGLLFGLIAYFFRGDSTD